MRKPLGYLVLIYLKSIFSCFISEIWKTQSSWQHYALPGCHCLTQSYLPAITWQQVLCEATSFTLLWVPSPLLSGDSPPCDSDLILENGLYFQFMLWWVCGTHKYFYPESILCYGHAVRDNVAVNSLVCLTCTARTGAEWKFMVAQRWKSSRNRTVGRSTSQNRLHERWRILFRGK